MKNKQTTLTCAGAPEFSRENLAGTEIDAFRQRVLVQYRLEGRHDMQWRHTTDPYHILVSEIMLQQTQVERVAIKFPEFIRAFPDFAALASAPLPDIIAVWQGMGYNRRAIALKKCAEQVVSTCHGILPRDPEVLATLPGIGPATAASICAFAFNLPVVFIETNIRRVFIHFFFSDRENVPDKDILPLVKMTLYEENPRVWYWALMDLGTSLKKTVVNPNRRSAHYTRQAPFEGSNRKIRGRLLKMLLKDRYLVEDEVAGLFHEDPQRIRKIMQDLEAEGFIKFHDGRYIPVE
ncbi:MAG: A/G-specific adenine glycosylase [Methanoregula sp.]|jgi:A/G-specific adenine glycosylase